jgi:hypothetical protein
MGAILYPPRYRDDVVNYSDRHRKSFIHCRMLAHEILCHLQLSCQLTSLSGRMTKISQVYIFFLVQQVQAFWLQQTRIHSAPNDSQERRLDAIAEAIARCFNGNEQFWRTWTRRGSPQHRSSLKYGFHIIGYTAVPLIRSIQTGIPEYKGQCPLFTIVRYRSSPLSQKYLAQTATGLSRRRTTTMSLIPIYKKL